MNPSLLSVQEVHKSFPVPRGLFTPGSDDVRAVRGVTFTLQSGETLGLVGESGCGKTTTARMIAAVEKPTSGHIYYKGRDIFTATREERREYRKRVQYIFQDPYASLNPRLNAGEIIGEPFRIHGEPAGSGLQYLDDLLAMVGLSPDQKHRYPHEFSGGQRQRLGIARAIALRPEIVIADEPVSALDVSVQAQILNLLKDLQAEFDLSYLFISHDMGVIRFMSDRVAVMYGGRIVETAPNEELFSNARHPYTAMLLDAVPRLGGRSRSRRGGEDAVPGHRGDTETGCAFSPRCPEALPRCRIEVPAFTELNNGHFYACHLGG